MLALAQRLGEYVSGCSPGFFSFFCTVAFAAVLYHFGQKASCCVLECHFNRCMGSVASHLLYLHCAAKAFYVVVADENEALETMEGCRDAKAAFGDLFVAVQ